MRLGVKISLLAALMIVVAQSLSAQQSKSYEGYRTRLIPYHSSASAEGRGLERQR